jgi:23S rRNA (guanosine2251-2'-O)-methyltransferase
MIKEKIKFQDSCVFEGMTSIRAIIKSIDNSVSDRRIEKILYDESRIAKISKEIGYFKAVMDKYGFSLEASDETELEKITLGTSHGGIVALCSERKIPKLDGSSFIETNGFYAMIEGIEDPYNFGYALRSLYATGCSGIILPERNWMSAAGVVCRSSAGASELFPIYSADPLFAVDYFKAQNYTVVCGDLRTDKILGKCELKKPLLLIIGGEKRGISKKLLDKCDIKVKIDYSRDFSASLSAASAATMFAYEIMRQNS